MKEATSAIPLSSGLDEKWWADSMEGYCQLRNVQDRLSDGKTPHERRFREPFCGSSILLESMVECHVISAQDQARLHQFGKRVFPGIFIGNAFQAGRPWKGETFGRRL